jgi:ribose 5-phosphate isomerase B
VKIAVGADHAGFDLKELLRHRLEQEGHEVEDLGTYTCDSTDYPEFAASVARRVGSGHADRGLLVCGSGVGMEIAANKIDGVRAANLHDPDEARLARAHNDANVIALGARRLSAESAGEILETFLATPFDGGRHQRRVDKIRALE